MSTGVRASITRVPLSSSVHASHPLEQPARITFEQADRRVTRRPSGQGVFVK
jgi:hypothetical protein